MTPPPADPWHDAAGIALVFAAIYLLHRAEHAWRRTRKDHR